MRYFPGSPEDPEKALTYYEEARRQYPQCAEVYYDIGQLLLQISSDAQFELACDYLQQALKLKPDWSQVYPEWNLALRHIAVREIHYRDRVDDGYKIVRMMIDNENGIARNSPLSGLGFRLLSNTNVPQNLGHTALEIDMFIKTGLLGWREPFKGALLVPGAVSNQCLLDYWKQYITVIQDKQLVEILSPLQRWLRLETFFQILPDGRTVPSIGAMPIVQTEWESQGRKPLLSLTEEHRARGEICLRQMGIPVGAWYVCLHVRELGYYTESVETTNTGAFRNADILTYEKAIKQIVSRGGWVFRMGDSSMRKLPPMDHVIDYIHTPYKSDWMDVFLCASCKFFFGTTSGLMNVPSVFGVPCALTNWSVLHSLPCFAHDIFIPKIPWNSNENRHYTFIETLTPPIVSMTDQRLRASGYRAIDSTPEEIEELAVEMLDRMDGSIVYSAEDEALMARARKLFNSPNSTRSLCRMGCAFLRRYSNLLPE
jgi:putative glycosyltransferase (TIGR04372 family)